MKIIDPILKPVNTDTHMHFSHLLNYISAYEISEHQINELESTISESVAHAKKTRNPVLVNWCGHFDLLITDCRIHVILIHKTFELPEVE